MSEKCAFLFPGQGAQYVGMGRDLAATWPAVADLYRRADEVAGFRLSRLCFEGPEELLTRTDNSQPAIYLTSFAVLEAMRQEGLLDRLEPAAAAGLSLGEFTALAYAGALSFEEGLRLVVQRGRFMQEAGEARRGTMAAVVGLDEPAVADLCRQAGAKGTVTVANINTPEQVVVSGEPAAVEALCASALERGARGAVPLKVSAAFHSPLMRPARERLAEGLQSVTLSGPRIPVVANVTGRPHGDPEAIRTALVEQVDHPVRWWSSMQWMLDNGIRKCYEIGPGRVLAGMLRRIDRRARCVSLGDLASVRRASGTEPVE